MKWSFRLCKPIVFYLIKMVIFIMIYILYFAWMGQRLFSGTLEGVQYFGQIGDSFFNMLVLMTTSNFPDIMLPAYQRSRLNAIYFLVYLILGLFLMMNLLLAIFYSNFKTRFAEKIDKSEKKRSLYLYEQFTKIGGNKDYLTEFETYKLFVVIHCLITQTNYDILDDTDENKSHNHRHFSNDLSTSFSKAFSKNLNLKVNGKQKMSLCFNQFSYMLYAL